MPGVRRQEVGNHLRLRAHLRKPGQTLRFGRGAEHLGRPLSDQELSKEHFVIKALDAGDGQFSYQIKDSDSTNGTSILRREGGQASRRPRVSIPVDRTGWLLAEGDIIKAGRVFLHFERSALVGDLGREHQVEMEEETVPFITASMALRELLSRACEEAQAGTKFVLLEGETGTGKEYLARLFGDHNGRSGRYVPYSLATAHTSSNLIISELFGQKENVTSAGQPARKGLFRSAHRGTLFLDELQEADHDLQGMLLRAVDPGEIRPLGADKEIRVDVQIIAATSAPVKELMEKGRLRQDFKGRICEAFTVPPLRQRPADIMAITLYLLGEVHQCKREVDGDLAAALVAHAWPENVRQLYKAVKHIHQANAAYEDSELTLTESAQGGLRPIKEGDARAAAAAAFTPLSPEEKREACANMLQRCGGNASLASRELGIARKTFYNWAPADK